MFVGGHVLLAAAAAALVSAGWRLAGRWTAQPLERALVAAVAGTCAAVLHALLLGRIGAAGSPAALTGAAAATLLIVRVTQPATPSEPWWSALSARERLGIGAALGALGALVTWLMRHPVVHIDATVYHLPEALGWVQTGDTGATPHVLVEFQTGSYPLTHEVLLAWGMGLTHTFSPAQLWMGASLAVLCLAGWVGLRRLGCGRGLTLLALAALGSAPILAEHVSKPKNDVPSLAWLAACLALGACAAPAPGTGRDRLARPALLGVALAAAGLAVGAKTTAAPLALLGLAAAAWSCRASLRLAPVALGCGALVAVGVGGVWYLRNLVAHGWFLWPFSSGPFGGDSVPVYLERIDASFLEHPRASLEGRVGEYVRVLSGGLVLVAGGLLAWLPRPRARMVIGASAATAIAALAWMAAPFTGRSDDPVLDLSLFTVRYLLPVLLAGVVGLALAGRTNRVARGLLAGALAWNVVAVARLGFPDVPSAPTLLTGVVAGALASAVAGPHVRRAALVGGIASLAAIVVAAGLSDGWVRRVAETNATPAAPLEAFFAAQPGWAEGREPVAFVTSVIGPVAGDRLRHPLELIPGDEPCPQTLARLRRGWVVVRDIPDELRALLAPVRAPACLAGVRPVAHPGEWLVYRQTATTSSAASRSSEARRKSSTVIAASAVERRLRNSVSSTS